MTRFPGLVRPIRLIALVGILPCGWSAPLSANDQRGQTYRAVQDSTLAQAAGGTPSFLPSGQSAAPATPKSAPAAEAAPMATTSPATQPSQGFQVIPMSMVSMSPVQWIPVTLVPMQAVAPATVAAPTLSAPMQAVQLVPMTTVAAAPFAATTTTTLMAAPIQVLVTQPRKCCLFGHGKHHH